MYLISNTEYIHIYTQPFQVFAYQQSVEVVYVSFIYKVYLVFLTKFSIGKYYTDSMDSIQSESEL